MQKAYRSISVILGAFGSSDAPILIRGVPVGGGLPILDGEGERTSKSRVTEVPQARRQREL